MWIVYLKEMRSLLRDRKTLIFTILIPIFAMPALGFGFAQWPAAWRPRRARRKSSTPFSAPRTRRPWPHCSPARAVSAR